jgi:hypothetical protein
VLAIGKIWDQLESRLSRSGARKGVGFQSADKKFDGRVALILKNASNISHLAAIESLHLVGANDAICRSKGE